MYIRCQSCGQLLYIPDDANGVTVRCPACKSQFVFTAEETSAAEEENCADNASSQDEDLTPPEEPLPECAQRESYHQPRYLKIQPFSSWIATLTAYRIFSQHFGVLILYAILTVLPGFAANWTINALVPELAEMQQSLAEKETDEEVLIAVQEFVKQLSPSTPLILLGIFLASSLLSIFLLIGGIRLFNAYGRKQKASFWLTLSGFDSPGRVLLTSILFFILMTAASVSGSFIFLTMTLAGLGPVGIILTMLLILFLVVYLFFVLPLIADSNLPAFNAFQVSYLIAKRNIAPLFGTIALLFLMMMFISSFTIAIFGSFLTKAIVGMIAQALFEPLLVGVISVSYLQATGQFRE